jgi:hypothetical protein
VGEQTVLQPGARRVGNGFALRKRWLQAVAGCSSPVPGRP